VGREEKKEKKRKEKRENNDNDNRILFSSSAFPPLFSSSNKNSGISMCERENRKREKVLNVLERKTETKRGLHTQNRKNKKSTFSLFSLSAFLSPLFLYPTLGLLVVLATKPALMGATVLEAPQAWHLRNMTREPESLSSKESGLLQLLQRTYSLT